MTDAELDRFMATFHTAWDAHDKAAAARVERIETQVTDMGKTMASIQGAITGAKEAVTGLSDAVGGFKESVGGLKEAVRGLQLSVADLRIKEDRVATDVAALQERHKQANGILHAEIAGTATGKAMGKATKTTLWTGLGAAVGAAVYFLMEKLG